MESKEKSDKIYVTLDSILDTRIATVSILNREVASALLQGDSYHTREEDVFDGIDKDIYRAMYKGRDGTTLKNAILTNMIPMLKHLVAQLIEQSIQKPFYEGIEVVLNVNPYKLSTLEKETLGKVLEKLLGNLIAVSVIDLAPIDMTPSFCKENYSVLIMYDYEEWFETQASNFATTQIPEITMLAPALYFNRKPDDKELQEIMSDSMHPWKAVEALASTMINLELIDIMYFSIISTA